MTVSDLARDRRQNPDYRLCLGKRAEESAPPSFSGGVTWYGSTIASTRHFCSLCPVHDLRERAWAAGFFDAEGSTGVRSNSDRHIYSIRIQVGQSNRTLGGAVLVRFREAVGGEGTIYGPDERGIFSYSTNGVASVSALRAIEHIQPWLGDVKRRQFRDAVESLLQHASESARRPIGELSAFRRTRLEFLHRVLREIDQPAPPQRVDQETDLAWAAGLFDGDGSVSVASKSWKNGPRYLTVRASVAQSGSDGVPAVLSRFGAVVGFGSIYGPNNRANNLPEYQWKVQNYRGVAQLVELLRDHLSPPKLRQAEVALKLHLSTPHRRKATLRLARPV